jgi:hypothetical protein
LRNSQSHLELPINRLTRIYFARRLSSAHHDLASKFVRIVTRGLRTSLLPEDLIPLVQDVVETHPGLTFLKEATEFHSRYVHTVGGLQPRLQSSPAGPETRVCYTAPSRKINSSSFGQAVVGRPSAGRARNLSFSSSSLPLSLPQQIPCRHTMSPFAVPKTGCHFSFPSDECSPTPIPCHRPAPLLYQANHLQVLGILKAHAAVRQLPRHVTFSKLRPFVSLVRDLTFLCTLELAAILRASTLKYPRGNKY